MHKAVYWSFGSQRTKTTLMGSVSGHTKWKGRSKRNHFPTGTPRSYSWRAGRFPPWLTSGWRGWSTAPPAGAGGGSSGSSPSAASAGTRHPSGSRCSLKANAQTSCTRAKVLVQHPNSEERTNTSYYVAKGSFKKNNNKLLSMCYASLNKTQWSYFKLVHPVIKGFT